MRLEAELDVVVRHMQHMVLQHGRVVGLYPYVIVEIVQLYLRFVGSTRFLLSLSLGFGQKLENTGRRQRR